MTEDLDSAQMQMYSTLHASTLVLPLFSSTKTPVGTDLYIAPTVEDNRQSVEQLEVLVFRVRFRSFLLFPLPFL